MRRLPYSEKPDIFKQSVDLIPVFLRLCHNSPQMIRSEEGDQALFPRCLFVKAHGHGNRDQAIRVSVQEEDRHSGTPDGFYGRNILQIISRTRAGLPSKERKGKGKRQNRLRILRLYMRERLPG